MRQINVETATRDQLVNFIRRMHFQLQREQERVKELESQISGFQEFLHEKNAEIRELRQQSDRLTEKSASDEETIGALIKQMEEMRLEQAPLPSTTPVASATAATTPRGKPVEPGGGKGHLSGDGAGSERSPEAASPTDVSSSGEAGRRPSRTLPQLRDNADATVAQLKSQNAAAASAISSKTEEIATLESKVRELMEVNAFYSAIVAQHDQEEKARMSQRPACGSGAAEEDAAELRQEMERLQFHISNLDVQEEKLQRIIKATEAEKTVLRRENEALKKESVQMEAEMEEITREYARARRSLATAASRQASAIDMRLTYVDDEGPHTRAVSAPQQGSLRGPLSRAAATRFVEDYNQQPEHRHASLPSATVSRASSPLSHDARQGMLGGSAASSVPSTSMGSASRSRFSFRSLRPIRVRNPDAHERDLLDRIHLYEERLAQMELFETDRQRSFDEMERNRAEMFAAMNAQLEKQRKEIHRLRKLHEDASLDSSLTARPSQNHSVGSALNRDEEGGRTGLHRHGSHSPVERCHTSAPTSTQSLPNVESFSGADDVDAVTAASLNERDTLALRSAHQRRAVASTPAGELEALLEGLQRRETAERLLVWKEAMEGTVELAALVHTITVQSLTEEVTSCNEKLFGERDALTAELEALQLQNEKLELRLTDLEAQLCRHADQAEADRTTKSAAVATACEHAVGEDGSTCLLEHKALCTAYLAMDAYSSVLEHYSVLIHSFESHHFCDEEERGLDNLAEEVTCDLAEMRTVFTTVKEQSQQQVARSREPDTSIVVAPVGPADPSPPQPLSLRNAEAAAVAATGYDGAISTTRSTSTPLTSDPNTGEIEAHVPPSVADGNATAVSVSQNDSRQSSTYGKAASCDEGEVGLGSDMHTMSTEGGLHDGPGGEAFAQLSADEEDRTATSQFADCVEGDEYTSHISMAPEGEQTALSVSTVSEHASNTEKPSRALLNVPQNSSVHETLSDDVACTDAEVQKEAQGDVEGEGVELHDCNDADTTSTSSQLEMTEAEEAELLAQLQQETKKDGAESLAHFGVEETRKDKLESTPAIHRLSPASDADAKDKVAESDTRHSEKGKGCAGDSQAEGVSLTSSESALERVCTSGASAASDSPKENASSSSSSSQTSTSLPLHEAPQPAAEGVPEVLAGFAPAAPLFPPVSQPSVIPPTSLDELFGGHLNAAPAQPLPPPPPSTGAAASFYGNPAASHVASPPLPSKLTSSADKPATPHPTFNVATPVSAPSSNSMFAIPPQPAPFRTFITQSPQNGNPSQLSSDKRRAAASRSSSSSEDEFEAGFDPFA